MTRALVFCRVHRWTLLSLLGLGVLVWVVVRPAPRPPVQAVSRSTQLPMLLRDRIGRWLPMRFAWVGRIDQAVFGKRKSISLAFDFYDLDSSTSIVAVGRDLGRPTFSETNGLSVWLLSPAELQAVRERLTLSPATSVFHPRVSTGDGIRCSLRQSQTVTIGHTPLQAGLTLDCETRIHDRSTDLLVALQLSEPAYAPAATGTSDRASTPNSIRTNLDLALRLQVPKGNGVFLVRDGIAAAGTPPIAVLLSSPGS